MHPISHNMHTSARIVITVSIPRPGIRKGNALPEMGQC